MTDRLDRIEAGLEETRRICESNARAIQANAEHGAETQRKIDNLANIVQAFIERLDSEGLKVTLITNVADDVAAEVNAIERTQANHSVAIERLIENANADRKAFTEGLALAKEQADADREAAAQRFNAQLEEIRAIGEQNRALISAIAATNGRVDRLEQAS